MAARFFASPGSPKAVNSSGAPPSPAPKIARPPLRRSRLVIALATTCGRRRASGVTASPSLRRVVKAATADRMIQGSPEGTPRTKPRWSHMKKASQPAASAARARRTATCGSAYSPRLGITIPQRIRGPPGFRRSSAGRPDHADPSHASSSVVVVGRRWPIFSLFVLRYPRFEGFGEILKGKRSTTSTP